MSIAALQWAIDAPVEGPKKAVLLVLAWHAREDGTDAFAGQALLSAESGAKPRTVARALADLERERWIIRDGYRRGGGTVVWKLPLDRSGSASEARPPVMPERQDRPPGDGLASEAKPTRSRPSGGTAPAASRSRRSGERKVKEPTNNNNGASPETTPNPDPLRPSRRTDVPREPDEHQQLEL